MILAGLLPVAGQKGVQIRHQKTDVSGAFDAGNDSGLPPHIESALGDAQIVGGFGFCQDSGSAAGPIWGGDGVNHPSRYQFKGPAP